MIPRINDQERQLWVDNDESLYRDWKRSRLSMRKYIRENRLEIDSFIHHELERKPNGHN